jgi:hypothetical protein
MRCQSIVRFSSFGRGLRRASLISVEFVGTVLLKGEVLAGSNEETVRGYSIINAMVAIDSQWQEVMQNGVQDLIEKMKTKLKSPN